MLRRVSARQWRSPTAAMRMTRASMLIGVFHRIDVVAGPAGHFALAGVEVTFDVRFMQVFLSREKRAAAHPLGGRGRLLELDHPLEQLAHPPAGDLLSCR